MSWTPIPIPPDRDPSATPYGFVVDYLWASQGDHIARRPRWPEGMFISVEPFEDHEIEAMGAWQMSHGVFFDDDTEYGSPEEDMAAADWVVSVLEEAASPA